MASGLFALLDDIAAIAKVAAASIDDVAGQAVSVLDDAAGQAAKVSTKAAGIVIDDAAVTPRYVVGFAAERELPIIWRIALGSLKNKLVFLLPGAIGLSAFAPGAITPLLMAGGLFLCFEGYEKAHHLVAPHADDPGDDTPTAGDPAAMEEEKVAGAIRTDIILSAEIMAISLANIEAPGLGMQAAILATVAVLVTVGVYGAVALIVKADDVGVALVRNPRPAASWLGLRAPPDGPPSAADRAMAPAAQAVGRGLVHAMPAVLSALSVVGTLAMLWVGGGILVHGLAHYGLDTIEHTLHHAGEVASAPLPFGGGLVAWLVAATGSGVLGLVAGGLVVAALSVVRRLRGTRAA